MNSSSNNIILLGDENAVYTATPEEIAAFKIRIRTAFDLFDLSGRGVVNKRDIGTLIRYLGYFPSNQDIKQCIMPQLNELLRQNRNNFNLQNPEEPQLDEATNDQKNDDPDTVNNDDTNAVNVAHDQQPVVAAENEVDHNSFEQIMLEIMKRNLFPVDDEETVLTAFKVIAKHFRKQRNGDCSDSDDEDDDEDDEENEEKKILYKNDVIAAMREFGDDYCLDSRELDEFLNVAIITTNKNNKKINENYTKNGNKNDDEEANEVIYYEDYVDELYFQLGDHA